MGDIHNALKEETYIRGKKVSRFRVLIAKSAKVYSANVFKLVHPRKLIPAKYSKFCGLRKRTQLFSKNANFHF